MNTHPLRDAWVKLKGTWVQVEEAVAWEELKRRDRPVDPKAEACVIIYRRSTMDYRRHADAEAFMRREIEGIRNTGGRSSEELAPKGSDKDIGLVVTVPHSIQPDYDIAYISTLLQAADILTKPFTNAEKWSRALALMAISSLKLDVRKSGAAAATPGSTLLTQRSPPLHKRLIIEVCCGDDSLIGNLAINKYKDCKVVRITESMNLNDPKTRRKFCPSQRRPTRTVFASSFGPVFLVRGVRNGLALILPSTRTEAPSSRPGGNSPSFGHRSSTCPMASIDFWSTMPLNGQRTASIGNGLG